MINQIKECIELAGAKILDIYKEDFQVIYKNDKSPVTLADETSQQMIIDFLSVAYPDIPVISEEMENATFTERQQWEKCWIIDPLDGTKEFVHKNDEFTINIALVEKGIPVFGIISAPALGLMYYGQKGVGSFVLENGQWKPICVSPDYTKLPEVKVAISRSHPSFEVNTFIKRFLREGKKVHTIGMGSSLKLCLIAEGKADVYPRFGTTMEWDIAAGHAIIKYAGGDVVDSQTKKSLTYNKETLLNPHFIAF